MKRNKVLTSGGDAPGMNAPSAVVRRLFLKEWFSVSYDG